MSTPALCQVLPLLPWRSPASLNLPPPDNQLTHAGCKLPIELWFPLSELPTPALCQVLASMHVTCRILEGLGVDQRGFVVKPLALLFSSFQEVREG